MTSKGCKYQIISRWPNWARWRRVTARPHDERWPFDPLTNELVFDDPYTALEAAESMAKANAGDYRVIPILAEDLERPTGRKDD